MRKGSAKYFYHYNAHGDVIALTNQQGEVVASYQYDAWGNPLTVEEDNSVADNPYRYAGYQFDRETGMYYLMARYYHPIHGVFFSVDPDPGDDDDILTQNGYTYVSNNPVLYTDPTGFKHVNPGVSTGGAMSFKNVRGKSTPNKTGKSKKKKSNSPPQLSRGLKYEEKVLAKLGLKPNKKKINGSIPDSLTGNKITEVKDAKYVYKSKQFRNYEATGMRIDLVCRPDTKISAPLKQLIERRGGKIIRIKR